MKRKLKKILCMSLVAVLCNMQFCRSYYVLVSTFCFIIIMGNGSVTSSLVKYREKCYTSAKKIQY